MSEVWSETYIGLHAKYLLFLSDFIWTWIFLTDFRKILKRQIIWKSVVSCDGQAGRRTDMAKLIVNFRNFANAPKSRWVRAIEGNDRCLFWEPHKTYKYTVWAERRIVDVKLGGMCSNHGDFKVLRLLTVTLEREWKIHIVSFIGVLNTAAVKECPPWYRLVAKLKRLCVCMPSALTLKLHNCTCTVRICVSNESDCSSDRH